MAPGVLKLYATLFTFSVYILFEILYQNSCFCKGLWATVTRRMIWGL